MRCCSSSLKNIHEQWNNNNNNKNNNNNHNYYYYYYYYYMRLGRIDRSSFKKEPSWGLLVRDYYKPDALVFTIPQPTVSKHRREPDFKQIKIKLIFSTRAGKTWSSSKILLLHIIARCCIMGSQKQGSLTCWCLSIFSCGSASTVEYVSSPDGLLCRIWSP